jgi:uncharacterized protein YyaL (SSP411 family)
VNRLARETSPYLRQHRDNPVDWYPWGEEAFAAARARDCPIFLSVGYSSCHWCHVMAHESFEDATTAAAMNERFVNVKVDREERPDVDAVYMHAVQAMTGRGGWPMSVWLAPDGRPFYGGTYFPDADRQGMPSFRRVLEAVSEAWRERRADVLDAAGKLTAAIDGMEITTTARTVTADVLAQAYDAVRAQFEPRYGGFSRAPKFPPSMTLQFLTRTAARTGDPDALAMVQRTLDAMAAGGIHDHLGGGFARYSTDERWLVPHFEKMLYDNALLVTAYLSGYVLTGEERYLRVVDDTVGYVLRDLRHPDGGFCSAEDADSEGEEGRFYVWTIEEIERVCGDDAPEVVDYFGASRAGNFEGRNILFVADPGRLPSPAVERGRVRLLEARARRTRPGLDDKVLVSWNALMASALARAGATLGRQEWLDAARTNVRFLLTELRRADGRLLRSWQADAEPLPDLGRARHLGYAEDYAALLDAVVTLAELDDVAWLDDAHVLASQLVALFFDDAGAGFFATGSDAEQLVVRTKDLQDNATPSASSLAANALLRFGALTGDAVFEDAARRTVEVLAGAAARAPTAFAHLLEAVERVVFAPLEVAIIGMPADPATVALRHEVLARVLPASVVVGAPAEVAVGHPSPLLHARVEIGGAPTAYVCERFACQAPVTDPAALGAQLDARAARLG